MIYDLFVNIVGLPSLGNDYDLLFQILSYCGSVLILFYFIYMIFNFFYLIGKKIIL